jgi:Sec-independent protein translocase protein TatA
LTTAAGFDVMSLMRYLLIFLVGLFLFFVAKVEALVPNASRSATQKSQQQAQWQVETEAKKVVVQQQLEQNRAEIQEKVQQKAEARCSRFQERLSQRLGAYQERKELWSNRYNGVIEKNQRIIGKLEELGCDASGLQTQGETLASMIDDFAATYRLMESETNTAVNVACKENLGEYVSRLAQARQRSQSLSSQAAALKDFVQEVLKPEAKALSEACAAKVRLGEQE